MTPLRLLDLFSGIGGFSLGLERSQAFRTVAFCEIEPFCRRVLAKHWPDIPCYDDVRKLTAERLASDGIAVDAICGGFPCQDISYAGKGAGLAGERSGLWFEYARLVGELGPKYVVVENVGALLSRGLDAVLGTLASLGYDAEWHCIPASYVGAAHRRDRVWIVAHAQQDNARSSGGNMETRAGSSCEEGHQQAVAPNCSSQNVANSDCSGHEGQRRWESTGRPFLARRSASFDREWPTEPDVGRVVDGVPDWSHRIKSLGNAVVPQIPELIGRAILSAMEAA